MLKITSKIVCSFEEYRRLILDNTKVGAYYLLYNERNFNNISKNTMLTRKVFTIANEIVNVFNIIKYISFKMKNDYSLTEMLEFITLLRQYNKILLIIYNPKKKDCFLLFISNKNDAILETKIKDFLEIGG